VADQPVNAWRPTLRRRLAVAAAALFLWSVAIEARLVYLQIVRHDDLAARAERQQSRTIKAPPKRGEILDRHGRVLAFSVDSETVYADPSEVEDPVAASSALCGALGDCSPRERAAIADRLRKGRTGNLYFTYVRRQVSPEQARAVAALELKGVGFLKESRRFYPNRELAAHVLGYVGVDNTGLAGVEAAYDSLIKGREGTILVQTDARRRAFSRVERPPTAGATLELTIDLYLQHIAERELRAGIQWSGAQGGSAIIMDPFSGEILALANYPTFNPNAYRQFSEQHRRNRAIQDLYEPGSTFKIVTAGAALEEKVVTPEALIDTSPGVVRFGRRVIDEAGGHNYGVLSFADVIVKSSNVGAIKVGLRLGPERIDSYIRRFGFGRPISPDFRGESPGIVWHASRLTDSALASVAMGYQVGVTPLQMAAAVSAVANGGELVQPRVVRAVIRGGARAPVPRRVIGHPISASTAALLTGIMERVVTDGTGTRAQVPGYTVAGKTGTAAKLVKGRYSSTDYNVSFVGFVPSRKPVFAIVVVIDSPRAVRPYGGVVAAPIFQRIADAALRHYAVPSSLNAPTPVLVARDDDLVEQPAAGPVALPNPVAVSAAAGGVPDVVGMSARDAARVLSRFGVTPRLIGTGLVVRQEPAPGAAIDSAAAATLWLDRRPAAAAASGAQP
jgi:cell division protein FtsI (penicillin-binding protein 3)